MGAGASAQPLVPPPTEPKGTGDGNADSLTSVHDARLAALLKMHLRALRVRRRWQGARRAVVQLLVDARERQAVGARSALPRR